MNHNYVKFKHIIKMKQRKWMIKANLSLKWLKFYLKLVIPKQIVNFFSGEISVIQFVLTRQALYIKTKTFI